jgi:hypothetical protein
MPFEPLWFIEPLEALAFGLLDPPISRAIAAKITI